MTEAQEFFLESRRVCETDSEAAEHAGVHPGSVSRWKKEDEKFAKAYMLIEILNEPKVSLEVPEQDKAKVIKQQMDGLLAYLPEVVQEHINIALHAKRDSDRLRAIEQIYEVIGLGEQHKLPGGHRNQVLIQMLTLQRPQIEAAARRLGVDSPLQLADVLEASYEELEEDADS